MKTTGLFTTHRVEVECELGKPFKIIPFGDVHRDSSLHADDYWTEFLEHAKAQKNALFLGMGDFTDGVSTSERIVLNRASLHESTFDTMNEVYKTWAKTLYNELSFMRGRCIGLLGGNHYFDFGDGDTTDHLLAAKLGAKFLGVCSFIRLSLKVNGRPMNGLALDIFAHHGLGGGKLPGSAFNKVDDMLRIADADLYLMGHNHAKGAIPAGPRLKLVSGSKKGELSVRERTPYLGRTGSFLKAYEPGMVGYNVDAARPPSALGWIEFEVTPVRDRAGGKDVVNLRIRATA